MYQELLGLIQGVKNQYLHKLLEMFFVAVSYTHLDVYKRQRLIWTSTVRESPAYS